MNGGYLILNGIDNDTLIKVEDNKANIWYVGGEYKFTDNLKLIGEFVKIQKLENMVMLILERFNIEKQI